MLGRAVLRNQRSVQLYRALHLPTQEKREHNHCSRAPATLAAASFSAFGATAPVLCEASKVAGPIALSSSAVSFLSISPGIVSQFVWMAPLPTIRTVEKEGTTKSLPPLPYFSMAVNGYLWCLYGATANMDLTIMCPNVLGAVFGSYYTAKFIQYNSGEHNLQPYYLGSAGMVAFLTGTAAMLPTATAQQVLGYSGCAVVVAMFGGPLQVISKVLKEKSTAALPFPMAVATTVNCSLWFSYGALVIDDPFVYAPNILGLGSAIAQLSLFARFGIAQADKSS